MMPDSEGLCRRGARRAADRDSPRPPAPDGWPQEPGASGAPGFALPGPRFGRPAMARQPGEGTTLAIPNTATPVTPEAASEAPRASPPTIPALPAALGFVVRLGSDGLLIATAIVASV